ncbi:hypothetical protein CDL12_27062 [Handroanthus impetiginosus]|uniref:Uncharacterized protein n=1 Tax=Handroanthus impetiginosus TaxID=429701 RepID=A0A2G9G537_9LAMI|nr:hypothetical protein CDL12_27062 [Handroanthus impetiginosus]
MEDSIISLESLTLEANRSWADFPQELLSLILSRLYFRDRYNFKLVCKSWNLVCPVPPSLPPAINSPEFDSPCLIISQRSSRSWKLFHSLRNDFYYMDFPELVDPEILYSNYGWLLMSKYKLMIFFFNHFTKEKIELPPVPAPFSSSVCLTSPPTSSDCIEEEEDGNDDGPPISRRSFWTNLDRERPPVTRDGYMIEVDGDIWGIFVTRNNSCVSVQKLDFCKNIDGSFAENCSVDGIANKIYFNKFHDKSGVMYKEAYGLSEVDYSVWVKPTLLME